MQIPGNMHLKEKQLFMSAYIHIAEPCHEDWNSMQPTEQGRHCLACCKTVVDFTGWNGPDIAAYLADPVNKKTCGRFYETQLSVSQTVEKDEWMYRIQQSTLSGVKKIAAIIIVVFGLMQSACEPPIIMGQKMAPEKEQLQGLVLVAPDTTRSLLRDTALLNEGPAIDSLTKCQPDPPFPALPTRGMAE